MQTETICDIRFKCRVLGSIEPAVTKFSERPADFEKFLETVGDNCFELFFANLLLARRDGVANWLIQGWSAKLTGGKKLTTWDKLSQALWLIPVMALFHSWVRQQPDPHVGEAFRGISTPSEGRTIYMKRFILLGLTALGLITLAPTGSKAAEGFNVYIGPAYQRPYYYREDYPRYRHYRHPEEYRWHRWHHRHYYDRDYYRD
jgi:hypothetical protein